MNVDKAPKAVLKPHKLQRKYRLNVQAQILWPRYYRAATLRLHHQKYYLASFFEFSGSNTQYNLDGKRVNEHDIPQFANAYTGYINAKDFSKYKIHLIRHRKYPHIKFHPNEKHIII